MIDYGLGRLPSTDDRDQRHHMRALLDEPEPALPLLKYWWSEGAWLYQNGWPRCVAYAWAHFLEDGPVTQPGRVDDIWCKIGYDWMQRNDEWAGEDYGGTSVRAGAKYLQQLGLVDSYVWAWDLHTALNTVRAKSPVVMGTNWYSSMFEPNAKGLVKVEGSPAGGHAWLLNGVNMQRGVVRGKNSWSRTWGKNGHFYLSFEDLERLIREDGEACLAVERKAVA